jgi:hypothetical protein
MGRELPSPKVERLRRYRIEQAERRLLHETAWLDLDLVVEVDVGIRILEVRRADGSLIRRSRPVAALFD